MESYFTIETASEAEFKDRGSKFLAYAFPLENIEAFKRRLLVIKKQHPRAAHHCFAYRIGHDGNTFRVSDDGEPSGSAGKPILGQLDTRNITNTAIIVARYFGGTLLGIPGLINAYKTAASLALQVTPVIQKQVEVYYSLNFDYTRLNEVLIIIKQYNCRIIFQEIQLFCSMQIGIAVTRLPEFLYSFSQIENIEILPI